MNRSLSITDHFRRAMAFHNAVVNDYPNGTYKSDKRNTLFMALCDMTLEHHGAIVTLVKSGQHDGSALALMRPILETSLRAYWTLYCSSDEELNGITAGKRQFPGLDHCAQKVEAHFANNNHSGIFLLDGNYVKQLHGLTHSGIEQLQSRIGSDLRVKPNYSDATITKLLQQSTMWLAITCIAQLLLIEGEDAPQSNRFSKLYVDLFRTSAQDK
jgi:hypothetical protein